MNLSPEMCELWNDSPEEVSNVIPDGKYVGKVLSVLPSQTQTGIATINWDIAITEGTYAKRIVKNTMVITMKSLPHIKRTFKKLGFTCSDLNQLDKEVFPLLLDGEVKFNLKNNPSADGSKTYVNLFFNSFTEAGAVGDELPF